MRRRCRAHRSRAKQDPPAIKAAIAQSPIRGRVTLSGYEGSELLVARLLVESGADVRYAGTACPRTAWSDPDRLWLESKGVRVQYRASLEQDLAAMREFEPDIATVDLLASHPDGLTNADIAAKLDLSYRDVERNTCEVKSMQQTAK